MFYDWKGRPTLMMPTLAFAMQKPGQPWVRASAKAVFEQAEEISELEFWRRFGSWKLSPFPVAFSMIDNPAERPVEVTRPRGA